MKTITDFVKRCWDFLFEESTPLPAIREDLRPTPEQFGSSHNRWVCPRSVVKGGNRHPYVELVRDESSV